MGCVELGGSDAGKDPSSPDESLLRISRSAATAAAGSSACLSNGAGSNLSAIALSFGTNNKRPGEVPGANDHLFIQLFSHLEMMLKCREGLTCPVLQVRVVAALGITLKQRHGILVGADLHGIET